MKVELISELNELENWEQLTQSFMIYDFYIVLTYVYLRLLDPSTTLRTCLLGISMFEKTKPIQSQFWTAGLTE